MSDDFELLVHITGIEMEMEAWELIRLFFDADSIRFLHENETVGFQKKCRLVRAEIKSVPDKWSCRAFFYNSIDNENQLTEALNGHSEPLYESSYIVSEKDMKKPGNAIYQHHKILAGSCMYEIISRFTGKTLPYGSLTGVRPVKLAALCIHDGMDRLSSIKHLVDATHMSAKKAALLYDIADIEEPFAAPNDKQVHVYVGIPFCASRCLYCSFTAYPVERFKNLIPSYLKALEKEIHHSAEWIDRLGLNIGSIYIGGGTPTALDADSLDVLLKLINSKLPINGTEFTVEAGRPDTITKEKLSAIIDNNVTRISINPQTMNDETLKLIGRNHTPDEIEEKYMLARSMGFKNINMDIIAGLPKESFSMFLHTLQRIEELGPDSLTVHTLAVKRASRLKEEGMDDASPSDSAVEQMIDAARNSAGRMGMRPYYLYRQKNILANLENTGYSKPGLECLYNIQTMEETQTIIALGAGAISKFVFREGDKKIERTFNVKELTQYIERIDEMLERKETLFVKLAEQLKIGSV